MYLYIYKNVLNFYFYNNQTYYLMNIFIYNKTIINCIIQMNNLIITPLRY
jgi:hypothetical protein